MTRCERIFYNAGLLRRLRLLAMTGRCHCELCCHCERSEAISSVIASAAYRTTCPMQSRISIKLKKSRPYANI